LRCAYFDEFKCPSLSNSFIWNFDNLYRSHN
jgi:hypothetical protein